MKMLAKTLFPGVAVLTGAGGTGKSHEVPLRDIALIPGSF